MGNNRLTAVALAAAPPVIRGKLVEALAEIGIADLLFGSFILAFRVIGGGNSVINVCLIHVGTDNAGNIIAINISVLGAYQNIIHPDAVVVLHGGVAVAVILLALLVVIGNSVDKSLCMNHAVAAFCGRFKALQRGNPSLTLNVHHPGNGSGGKNAENNNDHHHLDKSEAGFRAAGNPVSSKIPSHFISSRIYILS